LPVTYEALYVKKTLAPDPEAVSFVAKVQKTKTRKGKNYFIFRTTIPKEMAKKIDIEGGDYILFKAKKAQWYHMLDWKTMGNTWRMLPNGIRDRIIIDGFCSQNTLNEFQTLGATNMTAQQTPHRLLTIQADQGEVYHGNSI